MKAITFLGAVKSIINSSISTPYGKRAPIEISDGDQARIEKLHDFYSQPFKPEMITELFEGWECVSHGEDGYEYNYKGEYVVEISSDLETLNIGYVDDKEIIALMPEIKLPKSLDTFLSTVKEQMGGELTFKPEIVEKYFK